MAERDLTIKASVEGGPASWAEIDGINASIADLTNRVKATEGDLANLGPAITAGVKGSEIAVGALTGEINALSTAAEKIKASGGIIPPELAQRITDLRTAFAALTPEVDKHEKAATGAGHATAGMRAEMELARVQMGPMARAILDLTGSSNGLVAAFGRMLLPIAAAAGAIAIVSKVAGELRQRGVDVSTVGDQWGKAMDALAISMGGTSKAMAEMVADMQKTQASYVMVDAAAKSYAIGLNLLAAAQTGATDPMNVFIATARDQNVILETLGPSVVGYRESIAGLGTVEEQAARGANLLNTQLNVIRTTAPEVAKGFTEEYFAIQKMTAGSDEQAKALANLNDKTAAAAKTEEAWTASIVASFPKIKDAGTQYENLATNTQRLAEGMKLAQAANLTEQQTMALLGPIINNVAKGYETFGVQLRQHNPTMVATAEAAHRIMVELDPMAVKMRELALAVGEQTKAFSGMLDAVDAAARKSGDYRAALTAEHSEIDSEIISLEKQKATTKGLTDAEQARLTSLLALHKIISDLTPEQEKFNKVQEDSLKTVHDLSKSYEDLTRTREKDKAAIETHRVAAVAALEAELAKAISAGTQTYEALKTQLASQELTQSEYNQKVNDLFAAEAMAKRATVDAEDKLNQEAVKSEKEHAKTYEDAAGAIAVSLAKVNETLVSAKGKQAEYDTFVAESLAKVRGEWDASAANVKAFESTVKASAENIRVEINGITVTLSNLKRALDEVGAAASQAFGGAGQDSSGAPLFAPGGET